MCGFFITNNKSVTHKSEATIEKYLRFRGPDSSSGLVESGQWKAYHSRLSIIGLTDDNNQPMSDKNGGVLVFNGEILNYKSLGMKYFGKDYESDTKLLSDLICNDLLDLKELDGFYAFVYIDETGLLKHAVRDPFGVKPLYFHEDRNGVSFCSEPNVLNKLFNCDVSLKAVAEYRATRAPIFSGSYFEDIKSIQPGHCFVNGMFFDCAEYIGVHYEDVDIDKVKASLELGLNTRMISDAPVGLLLSRGIDSNLLRNLGSFSQYYTIGFSGDEDLEYLRGQNIQGLKSKEVSPSEYKHAFEFLLELRGEPMSVPNEVLLYLIAKEAAKDGIKVLLSGEGADEFFGGYDRIFQWSKNAEFFDLDVFLEKYCYSLPDKKSELYSEFKSIFSNVNFDSVFEYVRWFFVRYHMPVLFRRLDFSLMAAGVEGREPIANIHNFAIACMLNSEQLMGDSLGKIPLRQIISDYMGTGFAYEKKVGFPVDLTKVFDNKCNLSSYELWFKENLKVLGL